jgi:hypothetical protein
MTPNITPRCAASASNCWLARDDLDSEDDRKFIEQLKETSYSSIKRRQLRKLLACARELDEIEQYVSIDG